MQHTDHTLYIFKLNCSNLMKVFLMSILPTSFRKCMPFKTCVTKVRSQSSFWSWLLLQRKWKHSHSGRVSHLVLLIIIIITIMIIMIIIYKLESGVNSIKQLQVYFTSQMLVFRSSYKFEINKSLYKFLLQASNLQLQWYFVQFKIFESDFMRAQYNCKKKMHLQFLYWIDPWLVGTFQPSGYGIIHPGSFPSTITENTPLSVSNILFWCFSLSQTNIKLQLVLTLGERQ